MLGMPKWLATLLLLLLLVVVVNNPVRAGTAAGNAIDSMVIFFRSFAAAVGPSPTAAGSAYAGGTTGGGDGVYPTGGVASGDGTTTATADSGGGALALGLQPTPVPAAGAALASEATLPRSRPVQLRIPSIGISTSRVVGLGLNSDGTLETPQAADVVGWYRKAPTPGERGPAVVTAHVDWEHERGVFHGLRQLRPGSAVTVERADGIAVAFRVTRVEEYRKERFPTDEVYGSTDEAELRLITCGGRYGHNTRTYEANVVVFARMVGVA